jgi:hypothetical protein
VGLFGNNEAVGIAFQGKDEVSPVVRGIRSTMDQFKRDAQTGFGLGAGISVWNTAKQAIGMVTDVLGEAVAAANEEQASVALLTQSIRENDAGWRGNIAAVEEVIASRQRLGFADEEQRDSLRQLVAATKDSEEALRLQGIAMDFARLRGIDLGAAGDVIAKVYSGNIGILSRYGVVLEEGATATEALEEIQRRAQGQAEAYAQTNSGSLLASQIKTNEAMEKVGALLAPLMADFAEFAAGALTDVAAGLTNVANAFHNVFRWMNPHLALLEDTEKALRAEAEARGLDADAAVAEFRATQDLTQANERLAEIDARILELQGYNNIAHKNTIAMLQKERDKITGATEDTKGMASAQVRAGVSAEAHAKALLFLDAAAASLPKRVSITVDTPGVEQALASIRAIVALAGQTVRLNIFGNYSGAKPPGQAHGGEVGSGRTYLVGERGPELLTMGAGSGRITPNHRMGGGGGNVYLDGQLVGRVLDERMGRQFGMTAAGGFYRS